MTAEQRSPIEIGCGNLAVWVPISIIRSDLKRYLGTNASPTSVKIVQMSHK